MFTEIEIKEILIKILLTSLIIELMIVLMNLIKNKLRLYADKIYLFIAKEIIILTQYIIIK